MSKSASGGRVLLVDDEEDKCELMQMLLEREGFEVSFTTSAARALERINKEDFNVVVTDVSMAEMSGIALCERMLAVRPDLTVMVVTGQNNMETVLAAMRTGAYDFMAKPIDPKIFGLAVGRAVKHSLLQEEVKRLRQAVPSSSAASFVGESPAMQKVYDLIGRVGGSDSSVLISGESGTGKELAARAIHLASTRAQGPFVAINCAAVPATLIESELFGHVRGAFTDAKSERKGLFVQANGGTLFLDEIGEMSMEMQPKILRALQQRVVRPVGGQTEQTFDTRIITATNRDLETEVFEKRFREDLYYRINVVGIHLPPLRERGNDVLLLTQHFLQRFAERSGKAGLRVSPQVAERLVTYDWPGNVRELENCVERMVALARFDQLTIDDLPDKIRAHRSEHFQLAADHAEEIVPLDEVERRYILRVLKLVDGNKTRGAELLGLDRRTLYRKLGRFEEERNSAARTRE